MSHVHNLAYDSAFVAEVRGGQQFRGWSEDRYLISALVNAVRVQNYMFLLANRDPKKSQKPDVPKPWPIPDEDVKRQRRDKPGSFAFIAKQLAAQARRRKAKHQWRDPAEQK